MSFITKLVRNVSYSKHWNRVTFLNSVKCLENYSREIHNNNVSLFGKQHMEFENKYAYSILENKGYAITLNINTSSVSLSKEQFQEALKVNWSTKTPSEIFTILPKFGTYCAANNMSISDKIFDNYIDSLADNLKSATDEELEFIFHSLNQWPETPSIRTRNYIEIWVALDDECTKRMKDWSHDKMLSYASLFYMLSVIKHSDFSVKCLNKLASKAKQLTPGQFLQTMFFVGVWRKQPFDMHNLEVYLSNNLLQFSIDEIAIMSMGFFKSKTPIRDSALVLKIIDLIIDNAKNIHEVSLAALLKLIRYSTKMTIDDRIYRLLEVLQHEVPRLSIMCNVHIALVGTTTLTMHKQCLTQIANTLIKHISETRLKDLERSVLTFGTFNMIPQTEECLFTKVMDELRKPEREAELLKHGRPFACCVAYFALVGLYPVDLIKKVLNPDFLESTYGKYSYTYGREILTLNNVSKMFHADENINWLSDKNAKLLAKKYTDFVPSEDYHKQYNVTERMMLDVMKVLRGCRGGREYVIGDHILPHHQRGDIIICNKEDGTPVPVSESFTNQDFGLLRRPPNSNLWIVLVIAGRNAIIYDTNDATGHFTSKIKELEMLGYHATLVPWSIYHNLESVQEKEAFLNSLINTALQKSK